MESTQPAPQPRMSRLKILQVALLNIGVTLAILPLDSTLNRVMITELALPATLVAFLIALRFITSPLRIWFGRLSDTRPLLGKNRTWYIAIGMVLMVVGLQLAPRAALALPGGGVGAYLYAIFAFALIGFGVNMTTPLYFALVSDQSSEAQRPRIVALMFIMLGITVVIAAGVIAAVLTGSYSEELLLNIFAVIGLAILLLSLLGLVGLERAGGGIRAGQQEPPGFSALRDLLLNNQEVRRFFIYLVLTFVAIEAQEVILEPYAAAVFGMDPGETTSLTAIFNGGNLLMLAIGAFLVNRSGHRLSALIGITIGVLGFALIMISGARALQGPFFGGVFGIGMAAGMLAVTNLSLMMNMTDGRHAGLFLGAWGFAQGLGVGAGTLLGGVLRDVALFVSGSTTISYFTVYIFEIALLFLAIPFIWRLSVTRFRDINRQVTVTEAMAMGNS